MDGLRAAGLSNVAVVLGGAIPPSDVPPLIELGVRGVFPAGSLVSEIVRRIAVLLLDQDSKAVPRT